MSKKTFYLQLLKEEKELEATLESVRKLLHYYKDSDMADQNLDGFSDVLTKTEATETEEHNDSFYATDLGEYDQEWSQKQKTLYALESLNKGTAEEVAKRIAEFDTEFNIEKASSVATAKLSQLFRKKVIDAVKIGKKYRYYSK